MHNNDKRVPRPVRPSDFLVVGLSFSLNIARSFEALAEELYELAIYNANRKTKANEAWQEMARDLETLEEETDGR